MVDLTNDERMFLGPRLRKLRETHGFKSRAAFAREAANKGFPQLTEQRVKYIESRDCPHIPQQESKAFCLVLGVGPACLLHGDCDYDSDDITTELSVMSDPQKNIVKSTVKPLIEAVKDNVKS
ncbi:helix-turn-helix domain-containing protein [Agarilytica rhodophyticola]|uniref:helix-turn-helix domain-containing protein n=1 Tax=Agarilytica rhodophyticola TaxID=1737490 RepID=UPI000B3432E3|nr:helix-turn-helix transcriptional regulator [Agarilytica rhodophyticola]